MVSRNMPPKNCVVDFGLQQLSPVNLGIIIIPGRHRSAVQSFPSKLYFCGHKTPFHTHKSNLPNAGASERIAAVSHGERRSGKPNHQCIQAWRIREPSTSRSEWHQRKYNSLRRNLPPIHPWVIIYARHWQSIQISEPKDSLNWWMIWVCFTGNIRMNFPGLEVTLISQLNVPMSLR